MIITRFILRPICIAAMLAFMLAATSAQAVPSGYGHEDQATALPGPDLPDDSTAAYFASNGDVNQDGMVDLEDFIILKTNFGAMDVAPWTDGDLTGDGVVDLTDFTVIKTNFGAPVAPPDEVAFIPEPATATATLLALTALGRYARRRHRV